MEVGVYANLGTNRTQTGNKAREDSPIRLRILNKRVANSPGLFRNASTSPIQEPSCQSKDERIVAEAHNRLFIKICKSKRLDSASFNVYHLNKEINDYNPKSKDTQNHYQHVYKEDKNIQEAIFYYKNKLNSTSPILISESNLEHSSLSLNNSKKPRKVKRLNLGKKLLCTPDLSEFNKPRSTLRTPSIEVKFLKKELIPQTKARLRCKQYRCSSVNISETLTGFKLTNKGFNDL